MWGSQSWLPPGFYPAHYAYCTPGQIGTSAERTHRIADRVADLAAVFDSLLQMLASEVKAETEHLYRQCIAAGLRDVFTNLPAVAT